jgi:hypothetical protein
MSSRRLAWSLWAMAPLLAVVSLTFRILNDGTTHSNSIGSPALDAILGILFLTFPTVGAVIASRRPENAIGWLFLLAGVGAQLEDALLGYATYALLVEPGSLPAGDVAGLAADLIWIPTLVTTLSLLLLLFPTGRPPSRRWRPLVWVIGLGAAAYVAGTAVNPGPLYFFESTPNPLGVGAAGDLASNVVDLTGGPFLLTTLAAAVSLFLRFRRSHGEERQQIKWLVYTAGVLVGCTPLMIALGGVEIGGVLVSDLLFALLVSAVPVAVGAAILRHRLYDIDVVINRTLVYGALTATLVGAYLAAVLLLQLALSPLTEESDLAIAGSTLAVAALFRPARARIQAVVDRRFYRRRYDASRTVEGFSARLRDEVELDALSADLRGVVAETMQPAHVSLWLREALR